MKTIKKLKSKTVSYYIFPEGIRKEKLEDAIAILKPKQWIREYTLIQKEIIITEGAAVIGTASGTYFTGKEIKV